MSLSNCFGTVNLNACSLLTHDFVHADFGSGREPLDDCHLGVYFVGVLGSKFPSPTLSVSVKGGIPAKEDLTMTTVGLVGFHSFFLSFFHYTRKSGFVNTEQMFFSATPILVNHFAVFATAWADFVVELLATHPLAAALGEGQDFVDRVFHFRFPFLSLLLISTFYKPDLSVSTGVQMFFSDFLQNPFLLNY